MSRTQTNGAAYTWTPTPGTSDTYGVNGQNQLKTFNGTSTTKDSNGDLQTGFGSYSYGYDLQGQLRNATGAGNTVGVDYDPSGVLSKVTVNGAATDYLYDGPNLIAEYSGSTLLRRFVHGVGMDQPLVWFEGPGTTAPKFLHTDERGSIIAVSDGTGTANSSVKYSPEGQSGTLASPFGYTGQLYIAALDLYYYKARMYSPRIGRFLQPDPLRYAGGMNLYSYANNDPVSFGDPWGLRGCVTLIALDDNGREVQDPIGGCDAIDPAPTYTPPPPLPGPLWMPPSLNLNPSFASAPTFSLAPQGDQSTPCDQKLIDFGNKLAGLSDDAGTISSVFTLAGLGAAGYGNSYRSTGDYRSWPGIGRDGWLDRDWGRRDPNGGWLLSGAGRRWLR